MANGLRLSGCRHAGVDRLWHCGLGLGHALEGFRLRHLCGHWLHMTLILWVLLHARVLVVVVSAVLLVVRLVAAHIVLWAVLHLTSLRAHVVLSVVVLGTATILLLVVEDAGEVDHELLELDQQVILVVQVAPLGWCGCLHTVLLEVLFILVLLIL